MATVELVTESGKWRHVTRVNNELFSPILGAMVEEGIDIPSILTLYGSVAEIIERDWHLVMRLHEIMKDSNSIVYRCDMEEIAQLLNLPYGWEAFVVIDMRSTKEVYLGHLQASYRYLMSEEHDWIANLSSSFDPQCLELLSLYNREKTGESTKLLPFLRNVWLQIPEEMVFLSRALTKIDWKMMETYLDKIEASRYSKLYNLAKLMQGQGQMCNHSFDYIQTLCYHSGRLVCVGGSHNDLITLYSHFLPRVSNYSMLGLEPILGYKSIKCYSPSSSSPHTPTNLPLFGTGLTKLVGWVNATVICYPTMKRLYEKVTYTTTTFKHTWLARRHFKESVELLGKTVGIRAMMAILVSLQRARCEINAYHDKTLVKKHERVSEYIKMLYDYIRTHRGEDEGVRSLVLTQ
jgi:hypothetical protein